MAEFLSAYQGMNYKVPESGKHAKFEAGRYVTKDEQIISYLREHSDYGNALTEIEHPGKRGIVVDVLICPHCERVFRSQGALAVHMQTHNPPSGRTDGQDIPAGGVETED